MRSVFRVLSKGKVTVSAALALAICGTAEAKSASGFQPNDYSAFRPISTEELKTKAEAAIPAARKMLDDALVDSSRARIRSAKAFYLLQGMKFNLSAMRREGGVPTVVICVELNAPNRMGGMTGWRTVGIIPTVGTIKDAEDELLCPAPTWSPEVPYVGPVELSSEALLPVSIGGGASQTEQSQSEE